MTRRSRFWLGFLLVTCLAASAPAVVLRQGAPQPDCSPRTCQLWDMWDWQWWYFGCDRPMCPELAKARAQ